MPFRGLKGRKKGILLIMEKNLLKIKNSIKNDDEIKASILKTYSLIVGDINIDSLNAEDVKNIEKFYIYLSLKGALGMLGEQARFIAYEEMKRCVGNNGYSREIKKAYLKAYKELLEYRKMNNIVQEEENNSVLKLA